MQVDLNYILSLPYPEQRKWMRCFRFDGRRAINIHDFRAKLRAAIAEGIEYAPHTDAKSNTEPKP